MKFAPPLSAADEKLVAYFQQAKGPAFTVPRRQGWHKLVPMIATLKELLGTARLQATNFQFLATGLYLAGTGKLTAEMIDRQDMLAPHQKQQCHELRTTYLQLHPESSPSNEPEAHAVS